MSCFADSVFNELIELPLLCNAIGYDCRHAINANKLSDLQILRDKLHFELLLTKAEFSKAKEIIKTCIQFIK